MVTNGIFEIDLRLFFDDSQIEEWIEESREQVIEVEVLNRGPGAMHVGSQAGLNYGVVLGDFIEGDLRWLYEETATRLVNARLRMSQPTNQQQVVSNRTSRGINVNFLNPNQKYEWHVDGSDVAFTSSMGLKTPTSGGELGVFNGQDFIKVPTQRGILTVIPGWMPHCVYAGSEERITLVMSWTTGLANPDSGLIPYLYGET